MEIELVNAIKLGDKVIDLTPKNEQDLTEITNACINIMGYMLAVGTSGLTNDKERVEKIMNLAGKVGGQMAKEALIHVGKEKATPAKPKEDTPNGGDA
jgi:hypothetical protein